MTVWLGVGDALVAMVLNLTEAFWKDSHDEVNSAVNLKTRFMVGLGWECLKDRIKRPLRKRRVDGRSRVETRRVYPPCYNMKHLHKTEAI